MKFNPDSIAQVLNGELRDYIQNGSPLDVNAVARDLVALMQFEAMNKTPSPQADVRSMSVRGQGRGEGRGV